MPAVHIAGPSEKFKLKVTYADLEDYSAIFNLSAVLNGLCHDDYGQLLMNMGISVFAVLPILLLPIWTVWTIWFVPIVYLFSSWTGFILPLLFHDQLGFPLCGAANGVLGLVSVAALSTLTIKRVDLRFRIALLTVYASVTVACIAYGAVSRKITEPQARFGGALGGLLLTLVCYFVPKLVKSIRATYSSFKEDDQPKEDEGIELNVHDMPTNC